MSIDALAVGEALGRGVVYDHAGRTVGSAPDRGAIGREVAGLHALQEVRPRRGRRLGEDAGGHRGGERTRTQQPAPLQPDHAPV